MTARVLVTGAAGFIGGHVVRGLIADGNEVVGIDNFDPYYDRSSKEETVRELTSASGFNFSEGDIRDGPVLSHMLADVDVAVHLAARPGVRDSVRDPRDYASINVEGTLCVLDACRRAKVRRMVFASSSTVYGESSETPFEESAAAVAPLSPYAATKRAGELLCGVYARLHGFRIAVIRPFTVYGPRQRPDLAIHKFTRLLLRGSPVPQYGDGSMERDYTHVRDIVRGVLKSIAWTEASDPASEPFNLGAGRAVRLDQLISLIAEAAGIEASVQTAEPPEGEMARTCADTSKARRVLGYESRVSIEEGIVDFVEWYRGKYGHQSSSAT